LSGPARVLAQGRSARTGNLRYDVNLVLVPVIVSDLYDRPVHGLKLENFKLFEDGREQVITKCITEEGPISIGLLFDASNSMRKKITQSRLALTEFLRMSSPSDELFLMRFSDAPEMLSGFTSDTDRIQKIVDSIEPQGFTALYDAMYLGMDRLKHASNPRKILLVMSDGEDNRSCYSERQLRRIIREADVRIFSISILNRSPVLEGIAEESGGRAYRVRNLDELPALAANISADLHSHYVLGFNATGPQMDGKYRRLKVTLAEVPPDPPLRVSWRRGYYSPTWVSAVR
jgi:VWFA-related protein